MDDFLTPVSTTKVKRTIETSKPLIQEQQTSISKAARTTVDSAETALSALKEEPDFETVSDVLKFLAAESDRKDGFNLIRPDPVTGNIAYQLVNTTIPDYWQSLKDRKVQATQLLRCLRNPCGIGGIITRLRPLIADCRQKQPAGQTRDAPSQIEDLLDVLQRILHDERTTSYVWVDVQAHAKDVVQAKMIWKEFVTQVASGKILSLAAEAENILKERTSSREATWLSDGGEYASWLGRNIAVLVKGSEKHEEGVSAAVEICGKAISLGYTDRVVGSMLSKILDTDSLDALTEVIHKMKTFEQRKYLNAIITFATKQYFGSAFETKEDAPIKASATVSGVAALIHTLVKDSEPLRESLVFALTKSSIPALDDSLLARRSVIAAIAQDEDQLHSLLENSLKLFGDTFYVKHTPILQQEGLAQTLAISCGYVQRSQPMFLTIMAKSSYHISGMSNRIGASSTRARYLGIFVGIAISKMTDKPELQLKFDLDGPEATEAKWYQRLTETNDKLGSIKDLKPEAKHSPATNLSMRSKPTKPKPPASKSSKAPAITEFEGPRIVEILDESSSDEDDDLIPYSKPDSDPEDETDDPTEINRNKPVAPVYIRDLLAGLRDQENYERHELALSAAAPLIRRKANFGSEVTDHIEDLATILVGLHNNLDLDDFEEKRQQALIAVLLAKPAEMAQWFAREFFAGDYSLSQRTAMLTTLGLGARELAGLKDEATENLMPPKPSFPSKQLPPHLHALYTSLSTSPSTSASPTPNTLGKITSSTTRSLLTPLAAQAEASLTRNPDILKVANTRTFSTRMAVQKKRQTPIPNALAQIVAQNFFFPLTGRWRLQIRADKTGNSNSIYTSTYLLPPFLQTLALLMQAAGPSTLALPQMTRELWDLLLSVRGLALSDKRVLGALLFAFLMLLETNREAGERVATEQGKELMETMEWGRMVFEGLPGGAEGGEEERTRGLAAGVVVRCQEIVEKYERRLMGVMMEY
ncbi:hypothetical protein CC80DRAFT_467787 [Byssothecium circinans]|uniref:Telomere length regulation protein conserved domain-containing protein n=1 Tax=Byssothecium circinans TaxID=147558 RepID=A0A6A5U3S4_9PLEO|nr:hypothetical protein CC80DRAFT_467787 [Byssothecium circinans]